MRISLIHKPDSGDGEHSKKELLRLLADAGHDVSYFRRVGEQALGILSAGARQPIELSGRGLAPGLYIYRLEAVMGGETHTATGRLVRHR